jgi:hypothetical protein
MYKIPASLRSDFSDAALLGTTADLLRNRWRFHRNTQLGIRRILGVLALAKRYGVAATDDACLAALDLGVQSYRFVRRYLERHPQLSLRHVDPLIRELTEYRDLINLKTKEQQNESD